jgi:hypothetical protein
VEAAGGRGVQVAVRAAAAELSGAGRDAALMALFDGGRWDRIRRFGWGGRWETWRLRWTFNFAMYEVPLPRGSFYFERCEVGVSLLFGGALNDPMIGFDVGFELPAVIADALARLPWLRR